MVMYKVFVVEDGEIIREELCCLLAGNGYEVVAVVEFENVIVDLVVEQPHLVLLDVNLPYRSGYHICSELRNTTKVPIIFLTCSNNAVDETLGIKLGADDFISKPYNANVLLARIESVLKRAYGQEIAQKIEYKGITLDLSTNILICGKNELELTKNEFKILFTLIKNKGKIITRDEIINYVWQSNEFIDENTLTVNINRVRKKLEHLGMPDFLKTKRGQGYIV